MTGPPVELLREMARQAERVVDHQVRAMEELDDKAEKMLGLGVAALAGAVGLGTFTADGAEAAVVPIAYWSLLIGGGMNIGALFAFLNSYNMRFARNVRIAVGPEPRWLAHRAGDPAADVGSHQRDVIRSYAECYEFNVGVMTRSGEWRSAGLSSFVTALAMYAVAFAYIAGRTML